MATEAQTGPHIAATNIHTDAAAATAINDVSSFPRAVFGQWAMTASSVSRNRERQGRELVAGTPRLGRLHQKVDASKLPPLRAACCATAVGEMMQVGQRDAYDEAAGSPPTEREGAMALIMKDPVLPQDPRHVLRTPLEPVRTLAEEILARLGSVSSTGSLSFDVESHGGYARTVEGVIAYHDEEAETFMVQVHSGELVRVPVRDITSAHDLGTAPDDGATASKAEGSARVPTSYPVEPCRKGAHDESPKDPAIHGLYGCRPRVVSKSIEGDGSGTVGGADVGRPHGDGE